MNVRCEEKLFAFLSENFHREKTRAEIFRDVEKIEKNVLMKENEQSDKCCELVEVSRFVFSREIRLQWRQLEREKKEKRQMC